MRASPVRTRLVRKLFAIRYSVPMVIVFTRIHLLPRFLSPTLVILSLLVLNVYEPLGL